MTLVRSLLAISIVAMSLNGISLSPVYAGSDGERQNGGDNVLQYFSEGLSIAAQIVQGSGSITVPSLVPENLVSHGETRESLRNWIERPNFLNELSADIAATPIAYQSESEENDPAFKDTCAITGNTPQAPIRISLAKCSRSVTSPLEAALIRIGESVHHFPAGRGGWNKIDEDTYASFVTVIFKQSWLRHIASSGGSENTPITEFKRAIELSNVESVRRFIDGGFNVETDLGGGLHAMDLALGVMISLEYNARTSWQQVQRGCSVVELLFASGAALTAPDKVREILLADYLSSQDPQTREMFMEVRDRIARLYLQYFNDSERVFEEVLAYIRVYKRALFFEELYPRTSGALRIGFLKRLITDKESPFGHKMIEFFDRSDFDYQNTTDWDHNNILDVFLSDLHSNAQKSVGDDYFLLSNNLVGFKFAFARGLLPANPNSIEQLKETFPIIWLKSKFLLYSFSQERDLSRLFEGASFLLDHLNQFGLDPKTLRFGDSSLSQGGYSLADLLVTVFKRLSDGAALYALEHEQRAVSVRLKQLVRPIAIHIAKDMGIALTGNCLKKIPAHFKDRDWRSDEGFGLAYDLSPGTSDFNTFCPARDGDPELLAAMYGPPTPQPALPIAVGSKVTVHASTQLYEGTTVVGVLEPKVTYVVGAIEGSWVRVKHQNGMSIRGWVQISKLVATP